VASAPTGIVGSEALMEGKMASERLQGAKWASGCGFLASSLLIVGLSVNVWADSPGDLVPPVKVLEHVERVGPDFYRYDWPVAPGAWPTIKGGELEYPVGAYGAGFRAGPYYDSIANWWRKSGFDLAYGQVHVDYTVTGKEAAEMYRKYLLDYARAGGGRVVALVQYIPETCGFDEFAQFVKHIRDHPSLDGYDPADEPTHGEGRVDQYVKAFKIIRAIDPEHPIRLNGVCGCPIYRFAGLLKPDMPDVFGNNLYPVQGGEGVRELYRWADWVAETARKYGIMSSVTLGCYGSHTATREGGYPWWPGFADTFPREVKIKGRLPTIPEMRNQVYQCVIAGVHQVLWWPYEDWLYGQYDRKDLHDEMERLNGELHVLTGPIYSTLRYPVSFASEQGKEKKQMDYHAVCTLYRDALYVIALSLAEEGKMKPVARKGVRVGLNLPPQIRGRLADEALVLFDRVESRDEDAATYYRNKHGRYRTVPIDEQCDIVDDFGEYEVHVYRIALSRRHKEHERLPTLKK